MSQADVQAILHELEAKHAPVLSLFHRYHSPEYLPLWRQDAHLYRRFGQRLIYQGNPGPALELIREGLEKKNHPNDPELLYLEALALSRSGNVSRTEDLVSTLLRRTDLSSALQGEALSLYGRTLKDRYERADDAAGADFALRSANAYAEAFNLAQDPFPGVNAASMARLAGDVDRARRLARQSLGQAQARLEALRGGDDYWLEASCGEAHLLLGDLEASRGRYRRAVQLAGKDYGSIARMRQQLQMLQRVLPEAAGLLDLFHVGTVVAFAGHRIDPPQASATGQVRFPPAAKLEEEVRRALRHELDALDAVVGYVAPSSGADLLFAEMMFERGAELHLVLPFALDDFFQHRVDYGCPELRDWRRRCEAVLEKARLNNTVHFATAEEYLDDWVLFDFANTFMQGLALARARQVGGTARALLVLDAAASDDSGTELFQQRWQAVTRTPPRLIDLAALRDRAGLAAAGTPWNSIRLPARQHKRQVRAMLFADVKGFSKLPERKAPDFFLAFLQQVGRVLDRGPARPRFKNTWGDGLYVVLDDVRSAADFALRLLEELEQLNWTSLGLPADTGIRIGLHAGPVFEGRDPIIERDNYFGSHVSRAARIEPVTVPGCAFASEQFAACLAMEAPNEFVCEYLGVHDLAKGYDRCPLYRLMRRELAVPTPHLGERGQ